MSCVEVDGKSAVVTCDGPNCEEKTSLSVWNKEWITLIMSLCSGESRNFRDFCCLGCLKLFVTNFQLGKHYDP
jgi:hypothetical protein